MKFNRLTLVVLIALSTSAWVGWNRIQLARLQTNVSEILQERARLQESIRQSEENLLKTSASTRAEQAETIRLGGTIRDPEQPTKRLLVSEDPRWLREPANSAEWDPNSPYIWMPKSKLQGLGIAAFKNDGTLSPNWGEIFGMPVEEQTAVNKELRKLVDEYQRLVVASAHETKEHAPMIAASDGEKFSIEFQVPLQTRRPFKEAFLGILNERLGYDRSNVLIRAGGSYINEMFGPDADQPPSRVSVEKNKEGRYMLTIRGQVGGDRSYAGIGGVLDYIPEHLRPIFAERGFK